jgi:hypothetical protein
MTKSTPKAKLAFSLQDEKAFGRRGDSRIMAQYREGCLEDYSKLLLHKKAAVH